MGIHEYIDIYVIVVYIFKCKESICYNTKRDFPGQYALPVHQMPVRLWACLVHKMGSRGPNLDSYEIGGTMENEGKDTLT